MLLGRGLWLMVTMIVAGSSGQDPPAYDYQDPMDEDPAETPTPAPTDELGRYPSQLISPGQNGSKIPDDNFIVKCRRSKLANFDDFFIGVCSSDCDWREVSIGLDRDYYSIAVAGLDNGLIMPNIREIIIQTDYVQSSDAYMWHWGEMSYHQMQIAELSFR